MTVGRPICGRSVVGSDLLSITAIIRSASSAASCAWYSRHRGAPAMAVYQHSVTRTGSNPLSLLHRSSTASISFTRPIASSAPLVRRALGHADDRVRWRAQLVRYVRQKLRPVAVRNFRLPALLRNCGEQPHVLDGNYRLCYPCPGQCRYASLRVKPLTRPAALLQQFLYSVARCSNPA
jgi:hypothetical protein